MTTATAEMPTPTRRRRKKLPTIGLTRSLYHDLGFRTAYVEKHLGGRTFDMHGFIDVLAWKPGRPGMVALQPTAWSLVGGHVRKILLLARAYEWLTVPGNQIAVIGWKRTAVRGARRYWAKWMQLHEFDDLPDGACCEWKARRKGGRKRKAVVNQDVCLFG